MGLERAGEAGGLVLGAIALLCVCVSSRGLCAAQAGPSTKVSGELAFEAASIKPHKSDGERLSFRIRGNRFEAMNISLQDLVKVAYGDPPNLMLPDYQIAGGPSWIRTERFDVVAVAGEKDPGGSDGDSRKLAMVQKLLHDRFGLRIHRENREGAVYALVRSRNDQKLGPQLRRSEVDCDAGTPRCGVQASVSGSMETLRWTGQTIGTLAYNLSHQLDRLVIDRTGLVGRFDYELQFNLASDGPSIFTALQEQLALKLSAERGPIDVVVIDSADALIPD